MAKARRGRGTWMARGGGENKSRRGRERESERCLLESFAAAAGEASLGALFWVFGDSSRLVECEEGI